MIGFRTIFVDESQAVEDAIGEANARTLRVVGYETMRQSRDSIRPGRGSSRPGDPPRDRTGVLKRFIRYAVDKSRGLVVIGPEYLPRKGQGALPALEFGGTSTNADGIRIRVAQRPFMNPALESVLRQVLPRVIENSVTAKG